MSDASLLPDEARAGSEDQDAALDREATRYVGEFLMRALQDSINRMGPTPLERRLWFSDALTATITMLTEKMPNAPVVDVVVQLSAMLDDLDAG